MEVQTFSRLRLAYTDKLCSKLCSKVYISKQNLLIARNRIDANCMQSLSRLGDQVLVNAMVSIAMQSLLQCLLERFAAKFAGVSEPLEINKLLLRQRHH